MRSKHFPLAAASTVVVALIAAAVVGAMGVPSSHPVHHRAAVPAGATALTVANSPVGRPIPAGFVGLSIELRTLENYIGTNPKAVNPVFEQLVRNLAPGERPVLRFGGETTDFTWWPIAHMKRPVGLRYALTKTWLQLTRSLSQAVSARLILGVDLEADSAKVASAEARAMLSGIGSQSIYAFELGNEPELYGGIPWFVSHKVPYYGRPHSYDFAAYQRDFSNISKSLPNVPLAGPSTGSPKWAAPLGQFLAAEPRVKIATLHRYPLKRCTSTQNVTIPELLSNAASQGLAASVAPYAGISHGHGVPLRIDEMNSVSCGGERGVSDTFASALWAVDALFQMARVGVDGVNIHTTPRSINELFSFQQVKGQWQAVIHPEYYGLMMFAQAAPAGSRLLQISGTRGGSLGVWATKAPDGQLRIVLINEDTGSGHTVALRTPATVSAGTLERLQAPHVNATSGTTLGGQKLGSETGSLAGAPRDSRVTAIDGRFVVTLPPASAAMLTLPSH